MHTSYSAHRIAEIINGEIIPPASANHEISHLLIDSRKLISPENSVFFALVGERNDGHKFLQELYDSGVRTFVVSKDLNNIDLLKDACVIRVENSLKALQDLASYHRQLFTCPVIGLTGSNGKTIVKEWLFQLMREDKVIVRSPKSYNSQVGVPLSVWQMEAEHSLALFEAGISMPGEMQKLERIIKPSIGLFTNIGEAHAENFGDIHQKIKEKLLLFRHVDLLLYCKDYALIHEAVKAEEHFANISKFTWSRKTRADLQIGSVNKSESETEIQAIYKNDFIRIKIPFIDEASIENAIHCWAMMLYLGFENATINKRMHFLSPVAMRLEMKEGVNNCSIINDSYNSDLGSLSIALDFLNQQQQHSKKTLILSDILQSGKNEDSLYKEVAALLSKKKVNRIIGIGPTISAHSDKFHVEKTFYSSTKEFIDAYHTQWFRDETILIKGARSFGFEAITKLLQQKAHETVLEINLNALIHNINYFRSVLKPNTKLMAMVKAFSYGSGSFEIANVLQFHRVDYLAVAYADEGVELRKAGITLPIMVMNPEEQSFDAMLQYNLEPEIYSFRVLSMFLDAVKRMTDKDKKVAIHIELDTGMRRLGFEKMDINELIVKLKNHRQLHIKSIFSHFVGSDEHSLDYFTKQQVNEFDLMSTQITSHFDYPILRHISNSAGIARFKESHFDMVRLGIGLYGISSNEYEQKQLQNVSTLKSSISQIKHVPKDETIGYSRKGVATRDTVIATIPIGYADGLSRRLSNGKGKIWVHGKLAPVIGNVCMDMVMIDITDITAKEGDEVIIFGDHYPISEMAKDLDTIPYEVLTGVSRRVKRVYYQE